MCISCRAKCSNLHKLYTVPGSVSRFRFLYRCIAFNKKEPKARDINSINRHVLKPGRWTGRWTMDDGRWTMDDGRWTMDDGRWTMDDGRWTMDDGRCTMDDHRPGFST
jgi:hypothetical protein